MLPSPERLQDQRAEPVSNVDRNLLPPQIRRVIKPVGYVAMQDTVDSQSLGILDTSEGYQPFGPVLGYEEDPGSEYLEVNLDSTRELIKQRFVPTANENVEVEIGFSGSNEILERICMSFDDNTEIWGLGPHFTGFTQSVKVVAHSKYTPIAPPLDMKLEDALKIMMEKTPEKYPDAIFISNPDSRGNIATRDTLVKFIDHYTSKGVVVIMDEVNGDFLPDEESVASLTNDNSYLLVVRSYSKGLDLPGKGISALIANKTYMAEYKNQMRDHHYRTDVKTEVERISNPRIIDAELERIRIKTAIHKNLLLDLFRKYEIPYLPTSAETPIVFVDGGEDDFYEELLNYVKCTPGIGYFETYNDPGEDEQPSISDTFFGEFDKTPLTNRYVRIGLPKIKYENLSWDEVKDIYEKLAKEIKGVINVVREYRSHKTLSI